VRETFVSFLTWYDNWVILYLFAISTIYMMLLLVGCAGLLHHRFFRRDPEVSRALEFSALMPPISILAPAFNESANICQSVRAMLLLRYPEFEVVVINDGSKDETLRLLIDEFHLYKSARFSGHQVPAGPIRAIYESVDPLPLVVIDKANSGKADSLNVGLNVARYPLVCTVDADSILEEDALLRAALPFVEDPDRVIAVSGIVRVANGCQVTAGRVVRVDVPKSWIARFQVVEYLRAFLGGRIAFSSYNCLLVISGAFGLFSKAALLAVGGYHTDTVGEDMELVVRLHHWARREHKDYRIVFEPEPVCWTEVPESLSILRRQRSRWQRGTIQTLWTHRGMIANPRYGLLGLAAFPYYVLFEMFGPVVELTGYVVTLVGLALNLISRDTALLFFLGSLTYGVLLSVASVLLEELTLRRYPKVQDLLILLIASVVEGLGFRQLLTIWRAQAFWHLFRNGQAWGTMERKGFGQRAGHTA
jgi:cellulose synthase/poly-beta-1,6-N-acetylglucosamine synthase-like glycosyltransferase